MYKTSLDPCATSDFLPFAVTPPIHGFRPAGQRYELRAVIRLAGRPSVVQICSGKFIRLFKFDPFGFVAGMTRKWNRAAGQIGIISDINKYVNTAAIISN